MTTLLEYQLVHRESVGASRKETVGSVVVVILQPLCVFYLVTLLISILPYVRKFSLYRNNLRFPRTAKIENVKNF